VPDRYDDRVFCEALVFVEHFAATDDAARTI
jgi:hypothetical protein